MTKMTSLLLAATEQYQDDDGVAANATVAALGSWKSSNYGDYCSSLARLVVSNRTSTSPKAATYLAAAVHELWAKVDPLTRKNIKTLLMQALEMAQNDDDDAAV
ncbi:hypothetical protein MPSEU_000891100 [Mayamaea pseudoterrestris]|nr:hypothetical protein MPSEU_000891100 [Mayamaea pseudoterrestris]